MKEEAKEKEKKDEPSFEREIVESFIKSRKLFLWGAVDDESAEKIVKQMLFLNSKNKEPITLFLNSPGGSITAGMAIYDCMQAIESEVSTVVQGQAASMAAILLAGGRKGKRYAWPSARVMIHQPLLSGTMMGPASDIEIQAEEMLRIRQSLNEILSKHSGQKLGKIEEDTDRDFFMTAAEAKNYGIIDKIEPLI